MFLTCTYFLKREQPPSDDEEEAEKKDEHEKTALKNKKTEAKAPAKVRQVTLTVSLWTDEDQ